MTVLLLMMFEYYDCSVADDVSTEKTVGQCYFWDLCSETVSWVHFVLNDTSCHEPWVHFISINKYDLIGTHIYNLQ